ncbi:MAG: hypothetical protein ISS19_11235 [Bacteroidales bacterium]|nr:hypothetical protein [Bacteroidales bacterium]
MLFPEQPFDYEFVYDFHARMYGEEEKMANVVLALLLTIVFTLISMMYHTYKAARLQPADSLRYE